MTRVRKKLIDLASISYYHDVLGERFCVLTINIKVKTLILDGND